LLEKLEREGSTSSFVSVDSRSHEDEVRTEERSNKRERNGGSFIDNDQFSLPKNVVILRLNILE